MPRLRKVSPRSPGWTRRRAGKGFVYLDEHGARVNSADAERIRSLAIPPAWKDVWICPAPQGHLQAEVVYAASHEGALHLTDVLTRRTRISIEAWDRGMSAAPVAAELMGEVLGWDAARVSEETAIYLARVDAERKSQEQPDDESADRIRLAAPEISIDR